MIPYCFATMDRAILACYGWQDLDPPTVFTRTTAVKHALPFCRRLGGNCWRGWWC
jgi:hypothetical protein